MTHYAFPPARAYRLNKCLFALKGDDDFRARFRKDPRAVMTERGLSKEEQEALLAQDRERLTALGAHAYLVFMAQFRLGMDAEPTTFEYF